MCGISGFIDFNKQSTESVLQKMNRIMAHRGPDGEGYAIFNNPAATLGLGHLRLSIIDLTSGGHQPKTYGHLHITYNGEVYNHAEIKTNLEQLGHHFETHSDTEVILHAYAEWGAQALQHFIGMFAFVIYNEQTNEVFIARDRAGVKPLFYYFDKGVFLFASELKAIMQHPAFEKNIDIDAVAAYMQYGYVPSPHCIFKNTYKLTAGHYLTLQVNDQKTVQKQQYWSVYNAYNTPTLKIDYNAAVTETENILTNAFQYRMISDVPVGVFLSGGYDSACVTALLQKSSNQQIKTFTIGMPDAGLNEAPFAKQIAQHLNTDHTEHYCTQQDALNIIPTLPFYFDEPFADSSAIPTILVSKIAKEQVTVALSADAGDEIFAGYSRYDHIMQYGKQFQKIPSLVRKPMAGLLNTIPSTAYPVLKSKYQFHSRYQKIASFLKNPTDASVLKTLTQHLDEKAVSKLLKQPHHQMATAFDSKALQQQYYSTLAYTMAIDYETYLVDDILAKVDRAGMSVSLEGREPFLDHRIIEWAAQLPMEYKYNNGKKKFILKEVVHRHIPKEMMDRPKMGFGIPIANWLQNDLKGFVDEYFDEAFIQKQGLFNNTAIQQIKKGFYEGKSERAEKVWFILMFQMWYDKWMNNA